MPDDFSADTNTIGSVAVGGTAEGDIESSRDRDWFAVDLLAGRTYTIELRGSPTADGTLSDPYLHGIHDAAGNLIARTTNDDGGDGYNSRVTFTATTTGTYYIAAGAYNSHQGTYTVEVTTDDTRAGASDLGDITALDGPRFLRGTLDGSGDKIDYYRFTLTEAKRVGLGLRRQDADADLFLEDADGNVLHSSSASGTSNEAIPVTLLAGTYYVRVESQEAGVNKHVFRYGVSAPDPDAVAALEAEEEEEEEEEESTDTGQAPSFAQQGYTFALAENADGSTDRRVAGDGRGHGPRGHHARLQPGGGQRVGPVRVGRGQRRAVLQGRGRGLRVRHHPVHPDRAGERRRSDRRHHRDRQPHRRGRGALLRPAGLHVRAGGERRRQYRPRVAGDGRGHGPRGHHARLQPGGGQRVGAVRVGRGQRRAVLQGRGRGLRVRHHPVHPDRAGERRRSRPPTPP